MRVQSDLASLPWGDHLVPAAFERAPAALALIAPDGRWMRVNAALEAYVGRVGGGAEAALRAFSYDVGGYELAVRRVVDGELERASIGLARTSRRGRRAFRLDVAASEREAGRAVCLVGHLVELADEGARASDAIAELLDDSAVLLWVEGGRIVRASEAARRAYGFDGCTPSDAWLAHVESGCAPTGSREGALDDTRDSGTFAVQTDYRARHRRADGAFVDVDVRTHALGGGRTLLLVCEARRAEAATSTPSKVEQAHRLATIGALTAGVVHEINNPMTCVYANLEYAAQVLTQVQPIGDAAADARLVEVVGALADAREGVAQAIKIARDLKQLVRVDGARFDVVDPSAVLAAAAKLAHVRVRDHARIVQQLDAKTRVFADEARLAQIVLNLILNAAQAFPPARAAKNEIRLTSSVDGEEVRLEVHDNGVGIDPVLARRLFKPFVTDKPVGVGVGLGLSIGHDLATRMGARLSFESTLGVGTTFRLTFRVVKSSPRSDAPVDVLLVGGGEDVRAAVVAGLGRAGRLVAVASAADAHAELQARRFDLVVFVDVGGASAADEDVCETLEDVRRMRAARVALLVRDRLGAPTRALIERAGPFLVVPMPLGAREVDVLLDQAREGATGGTP